MTGSAPRNFKLRTSDESGCGGGEERDRAGDFLGFAKPAHWYLSGARDLRIPIIARLGTIFARCESAFPLTRIDQSEHDRVDPNARSELARERFQQILRTRACRRRSHHVGLRLVGKERIHSQDGSCIALVEERPEGADRIDLAEELELKLFAPSFICCV